MSLKSKRIMYALTIVCACMVMTTAPMAQQNPPTGIISGKVFDGQTGEALLGVTVTVIDTKLGAFTDLDGNFRIERVPIGTYSLKVSSVGYQSTTIVSVKVDASQAVDVNVTLQPAAVQLEGITVQSKAVQNTDAALLKHRQAATTVTDAISSEEISRSGSGDAAEAMSKVVGATVMDGRYVYVRGLGDRYSNTQLNGSLLPTSDPQKQAVEMDLIPANLLDNIIISKTFSPDKPGNFSGGSIDMVTKDFPETRTLNVSIGNSYNSLASLNDNFLTFTKGDLVIPADWNTSEAAALGNDWIGFTRSLDTAEFVSNLSNTFGKYIRQYPKTSTLNNTYSISYGDSFQVFGRRFGLNGSVSHNRSNKFYDDGVDAKYKLSNTGEPDLVLQHYLHDTKSTNEELRGGLLNTSYNIFDGHKLGGSYVYNATEEMVTRFLDGGAPATFSLTDEDTVSAHLQAMVLEYNERKLNSLQFKGEHALGTGRPIRLSWQTSFSKATQETPDQRFFNQKVSYWGYNDDGEWVEFETPVYKIDATDIDIMPTRYFRNIKEKNREYKADLNVPFDHSVTFKTGFFLLNKERDHRERIFVYNREGEYSGDYQEYYNSIGYTTQMNINYRTGDTTSLYIFNNYINEATTPNRQYRGTQDIIGIYGMFELRPWSRLLVVSGVRYEKTDMFVENGYDTTAENYNSGYASGTIDTEDWLPSVNMVYAMSPKMNLRASYGRTLARPTIREFAPYGSFDFGGSGKLLNGNPDLQRTLIDNYDLRLEWFTRSGEILAVSGFYKNFADPIEMAIVSTNEDQIQPQNIDEGTLYGVEFEFRQKLGIIIGFLRNFDLNANLALVHSTVDIPEDELVQMRAFDAEAESTRPMFGQAPYVMNMNIGYTNQSLGTSLNLIYNRVGKRLAFNSPGGTPDVYEQARTTIDAAVSKNLFFGLSMKLGARNLTDSRVEQNYDSETEDAPYSVHGIGRSFSVGISYKMD